MDDNIIAIAGAVAAGGLIGLEREWRGRDAGFRTHILVCLASALLMRAALLQGEWSFVLLPGQTIVLDPTRMAHGVLTGLGFLCAGVIVRTGFSVQGLTTAATLWITATIGCLYGVGLTGLAHAATAITVVILIILRLVSLKTPSRFDVDVTAAWSSGAPDVGREVEQALRRLDPRMRALRLERLNPEGLTRHTWRVRLWRRGDLGRFEEELDRISGLGAYLIEPRDE